MIEIAKDCFLVPKSYHPGWQIGQVIDMSRFDLSIGPILHIRDIITGDVVKMLPMHIDKLAKIGKARLISIVVPKDPCQNWQIGKVIGVSGFDLGDIGPIFHIRDLINGKLIIRLPRQVDRLMRVA